MGNYMVKEHELLLMETSMKGSSRTEKEMEKEKGVPQMEEITLGNGKMVENTVKELSHFLMGKSM